MERKGRNGRYTGRLDNRTPLFRPLTHPKLTVSQLGTDNRVLNQIFPESLAFVRVLERLLVRKTGIRDGTTNQQNALRVEVEHDHAETFAEFSDEVFDCGREGNGN